MNYYYFKAYFTKKIKRPYIEHKVSHVLRTELYIIKAGLGHPCPIVLFRT